MCMLQKLKFLGLCAVAACGMGCIDLIASEEPNHKWTGWGKDNYEVNPKDGMVDRSTQVTMVDESTQKVETEEKKTQVEADNINGSVTSSFLIKYGVPVVKTILFTGIGYCAKEILPTLLNTWAQSKPLNQITQLVANLAKAASEAEAVILQQKLLDAFAKLSTIKDSDIATLQKICRNLEKCKYKDENLCQITHKKYMNLLKQSESTPPELQDLTRKKCVNIETKLNQ